MITIAERVYREAAVGAVVDLPKLGTPLENRYVFDSSAREIKQMAEFGRVKIIDERRDFPHDGALITALAFTRLN